MTPIHRAGDRRAPWLAAAAAAAVCIPFPAAAVAQDPAPGSTDAWREDPGAVVSRFLDRAEIEPVRVLLLGTFHFDDQGLDEHRPRHRFDALADDRQEQIGILVDDLARFDPEVVCVERKAPRQEALDARYAAYRAGELEERANETVQVGFRLADRLGLERVHGIDAEGRWLEPRVDPLAWAREHGHLADLATPLQDVYADYLSAKDRFIDRAALSTILRYMNHPDVLAASHAVYLVGTFRAGDGDEYPGVDGFPTHWFNRNLRIFANLQRVTRPGQRAVVVIGAGHVPILRHCVQASPEFELVEVRDVVQPADRG